MDPDRMLREITREDEYRLSLREFAICMFNEFGGPDGLARAFKLCYDSTKEGSTPRVQMLGNAVRLLERVDGMKDGDENNDAEQIEAQLKQAIIDLQ